jgi:hypothetical protein
VPHDGHFLFLSYYEVSTIFKKCSENVRLDKSQTK